MVAHEGGQPVRGLVVGRVRLEDEAGHVGHDRAQVAGGLRVVVEDAHVVELHARLYDEGDDPVPGLGHPGLGEGGTVLGQRGLRVVRRGRGERLDGLLGTAGHGHLGADHVDHVERLVALAGGLLGDPGQPGGALGDQGARERGGVAGADHAAVEVDLGEAGSDVRGDQHLGPVHGVVGTGVAPPVRPEVVAAEDEAVARKADAVDDVVHECGEVGGPQAGVAAVLVDLVGGRLDEQQAAVGVRLAGGRLEHDRVRGADRGDAHGGAGVVPGDEVTKRVWVRGEWGC